MAVLDERIQTKIDDLTELAYEKFQAGSIGKSFEIMEQAWGLYPEPKENWNEAYNTAKYIVDDCFEIGDFEKVEKWLNEMIKVNNNLHQSDEECTFYIGKFYFEISHYEESLQNFKEVVEDAGFRYFEDENPKYLDFYKNPQKYSKYK